MAMGIKDISSMTFEEVFTFDNLYNAAKQSCKNVR